MDQIQIFNRFCQKLNEFLYSINDKKKESFNEGLKMDKLLIDKSRNAID